MLSTVHSKLEFHQILHFHTSLYDALVSSNSKYMGNFKNGTKHSVSTLGTKQINFKLNQKYRLYYEYLLLLWDQPQGPVTHTISVTPTRLGGNKAGATSAVRKTP
jgi:hypothetical protein